MSYGEFDFAKGTEFEQGVMRYLWHKYSERRKDFCKPDIYDVATNIMHEAKDTRPYYNTDPAKDPNAEDVGTGLPINQYDRYLRMVKNGIRVVFWHKLTEGKYKDVIFVTELTDELDNKKKLSPNKKTVYWHYEDLRKTTIKI